MKKIFLQGRYSKSIEYYSKLISENSKLNWTVVNDPNNCDYFLSFDSVVIPNKNIKTKYILIRSEPKIILPWCYTKKYSANFDLILDVGKAHKLELRVVPQPQNILELKKNKNREETRLVMINSNLLSIRRGELYSLRRAAIHNFENIDLYGHNWKMLQLSKIKNVCIEFYRLMKHPTKFSLMGLKLYFKPINKSKGVIKNKNEIMSNYKYALVIENSFGYLSEKLFDALASGCIPIYVGEDLNLFNFPDGLVIQSQATIESLLCSFEHAKKLDYETWQKKCFDWLENAKTIEKWSYSSFFSNINECIK